MAAKSKRLRCSRLSRSNKSRLHRKSLAASSTISLLRMSTPRSSTRCHYVTRRLVLPQSAQDARAKQAPVDAARHLAACHLGPRQHPFQGGQRGIPGAPPPARRQG
eukprot:jgi/Tetstr1/463060/TSEL_007997.t1